MKPSDIHAEAEAELRRAVSWYDRQRDGLGDEFLAEFSAATTRVRANPLAYADEEGDGDRQCPLGRFPFTITYVDEPGQVWVVAVADQRRRPRYWARRLLG